MHVHRSIIHTVINRRSGSHLPCSCPGHLQSIGGFVEVGGLCSAIVTEAICALRGIHGPVVALHLRTCKQPSEHRALVYAHKPVTAVEPSALLYSPYCLSFALYKPCTGYVVVVCVCTRAVRVFGDEPAAHDEHTYVDASVLCFRLVNPGSYTL
jgi:hypothetical protein